MRVKHQYRFFLPEDSFQEDRVTFPEEVSRQIARVLRLGVGDHVVALDSSGLEYLVELTSVDRLAGGNVLEKVVNTAEALAGVQLFQATLKGKKFETAVQKATELGVSSICPVECERSVPEAMRETRLRRLEEIAREAAEQSGRGILPSIHPPLSFDLAARLHSKFTSVLFHGGEGADSTLSEALSSFEGTVTVFIGPEGGFSEAEIEVAHSNRISIVSLGPRTLRAETATVSALTLVMYELGQLAPLPGLPPKRQTGDPSRKLD